MKYLRACWRFFGSPECDLWFGGYFFCRFMWLVKDYPLSGRTNWDIAYVLLIGIAFVFCTMRGIQRSRKAAHERV